MDTIKKIGVDKSRPPPIKLLSSQLRECSDCSSGPSGKVECKIKRLGDGKPTSLGVSMVWMQGTVLEVHLDRSTVLLLDETGTFEVNGINAIPKGKPCLSQGKYVMVMGVIHAVSPEPIIRAVKMADLSVRGDIHRSTWKFEVEELQQILP